MMPMNATDDKSAGPSDKKGGAEIIKGWLYLVCCVLIILMFMFQLGPRIEELSMMRPIAEFIRENEIDASAMYYTEIEEFSVAESHMKDTMDYPPQRNGAK